MRIKIFISVSLVLGCVSCNDSPVPENPQQQIPKALEEKSVSYELVTKRGYDDLVESLYNELVSKDIDLKKLEDKIDELNKTKADSTNTFEKFNQKNQSYFSAANTHIAEIKDSLLRDKMSNLIAGSLTKYNSSIDIHNDLLKIIETRRLTIFDLHNILKIVKTLPLIEKYQYENLPGTKSLEGYIKQQDATIKLADTLIKK